MEEVWCAAGGIRAPQRPLQECAWLLGPLGQAVASLWTSASLGDLWLHCLVKGEKDCAIFLTGMQMGVGVLSGAKPFRQVQGSAWGRHHLSRPLKNVQQWIIGVRGREFCAEDPA